MKLKVAQITKNRIWLDSRGVGGAEMDLSVRSQHIVGMDLEVGDEIEITITKVKKKIAKKKSVKKKKPAKKKKSIKKKK